MTGAAARRTRRRARRSRSLGTRAPSAGAFVASPAALDGFVVVASAKGEVSAINVVDGTTAWKTTAVGGISASPTLDHGRIFFPTTNGQIQALHMADGTIAWWRAFGGQNYGSPAVLSDGLGSSLVIAAGFPQQKVVRLSASTGATQWADGAGSPSPTS